jgi:zinc transport system substrate-binding protein
MKILKLSSLLVTVIFITIVTYYFWDKRQVNVDNDDSSSKIKVATSIFPIYDVTKQIAGDKIDVINILPSGASPHTFEPTIENIKDLNNINLVLTIGLELDNWAKTIVPNSPKVIELHNGVELLKNEEHEEDDDHSEDEDEHEEGDDHSEDEDEHEGDEDHESEEHEHGEFDPHYWLSPLNMIIISETITNELIALDPENKSYYLENLKLYQEELNSFYAENQAKFSELKSNKIITFHNAFAYFAKDFNLEIVAVIEAYPGQEPTAQYLKEVTDIINETQIKAIFREPQLSDAVVSALANDYSLEIQTLDPIGGVDDRSNYIDLLKYNLETIYIALNQ